MQTVLIVIHLLIVLALVVIVLLQRSEGGALGIGGGGGGGLMSARGAANVLTRTTAILAAAFFATSLALAILARYGDNPTDILDRIPAGQTGGAVGGGSLLDDLGGLPENETPAAEPAPSVPFGTSDVTPGAAQAPTQDAPATTQQGVPFGDAPSNATAPADTAPEQIPANPGETAPNAADTPTVPPVEAPSPAAESPDVDTDAAETDTPAITPAPATPQPAQ